MLRGLLTSLIVCLGFPVFAADLPVKAAPAAPIIYTGWQGLYVGVQGGQTLGAFSPFCRACGATGTEINLDDNAWFVGGQMRYLVQPSTGFLVVGAELGVQYLGFKSQADTGLVVAGAPVLLQQKVDWLAYANVVIGIAIGQSGLVYINGGPAWAHAKGEVLNIAAIDTSNTNSLLGFNIGGGIEWKLWQNASLALQYDHFDFGDVQAASSIFATALALDSKRLSFEQVKAKLNFKLN